MPLEVLTVAGTFVLAIISFNVALIALDIVEHVLMLMKKLGRILLEQFYEFIEFGLTLQQWMFIQKLAGIVVRLQFVECLKITDAEFRHGGHIIRLRFLVQEPKDGSSDASTEGEQIPDDGSSNTSTEEETPEGENQQESEQPDAADPGEDSKKK